VAAASSARSAGQYEVVEDDESDRAPVLAEALVIAESGARKMRATSMPCVGRLRASVSEFGEQQVARVLNRDTCSAVVAVITPDGHKASLIVPEENRGGAGTRLLLGQGIAGVSGRSRRFRL
jgi:hypothetical protein